MNEPSRHDRALLFRGAVGKSVGLSVRQPSSAYVCMYVSMYVCMFVCMCVWNLEITTGRLFKNRLCTWQNLCSSRIFAWVEFGTQITQMLIKFRDWKHFWNRRDLSMLFGSETSLKMNSKRPPNAWSELKANGLGTTLTTSSKVVGFEYAFKGLQAAHFGCIWTIFEPPFKSRQAVLTSFPEQISLGKFNSQFLYRDPPFTTCRTGSRAES